MNVFTSEDALAFLAEAVPDVPAGPDPNAAARVAQRCGYLPLALGLVAGHIRAKPDWTFTDHADWLDERHHDRRLDTGIELTLDLSYQHLPADQRRLLRLLALHPGPDLDTYAAAALADTSLDSARRGLEHLCDNHLLQQIAPDRYTFHDLIQAYASVRAHDEDRPPTRRAALTRLFDSYLAITETAMTTLHPADAHSWPRICRTAAAVPDLTDPDAARQWLDGERHILIAVAEHTATHGWPTHTTRLARILFRYLSGGHFNDALTVNAHALHAARQNRDLIGQAYALNDMGVAHLRLGRPGLATDYCAQALRLFGEAADPVGQSRALNNLGSIALRSSRYRSARDHFEQALTLCRQSGDRTDEARTLNNLGDVEGSLGHHQRACDHYEQALTLHRRAGNLTGEANALDSLGAVEVRSGRYAPASDHYARALSLFRQAGNRTGEASVLDGLGMLHTRLGQPHRAAELHRQAWTILRETGSRNGESWALNGLGEAAYAAGRAADARTHHTAAHTIATDVGDLEQQARAHAGLGHAHLAAGDAGLARHHFQQAVSLYTRLELPEVDEITTHLAGLDRSEPDTEQ